MAGAPLLQVAGLQRTLNDRRLWSGISFDVAQGDIWFLRGPSGVGKTLLLRAIACLDPLEAGTLRLRGQMPSEVGMACWRTQVMYVHQSRVNFKGTPQEFFERACAFAAQAGRPRGDLPALAFELGLEQRVLHQQWAELSGGQAQRVALAISLSLRPAVLLLDEPTSACDLEAAIKVEAVLRRCDAAILWVTHDDAQPVRVGGKVLELPAGSVSSIGRHGSAASLHHGAGGSSSELDRSATWAGPPSSSYASFVAARQQPGSSSQTGGGGEAQHEAVAA